MAEGGGLYAKFGKVRWGSWSWLGFALVLTNHCTALHHFAPSAAFGICFQPQNDQVATSHYNNRMSMDASPNWLASLRLPLASPTHDKTKVFLSAMMPRRVGEADSKPSSRSRSFTQPYNRALPRQCTFIRYCQINSHSIRLPIASISSASALNATNVVQLRASRS